MYTNLLCTPTPSSLQTMVGTFIVCEDEYYQLLCVTNQALSEIKFQALYETVFCARS